MPVNTVNQEQEYPYISSEFFTLSYRQGTDWINVPGVQGFTNSNTGSPVRQVKAANAAPIQRTGLRGVQDISIDALAVPTHRAYRRLKEAQDNRESLVFRIDTDGERAFTSVTGGATAGCTTAGVLTFNSTSVQSAPSLAGDSFGEGSVVSIGASPATAKNVIIESISSTGAMTAFYIGDTGSISAPGDWALPSTAITAALFRIWNPPPNRFEFTAKVSQAVEFSLPSEGEMTTTLMLALRKPMPAATLFIPTT